MKNLILILSILISGFGYSQCAWYNTNVACTDNAPTVINSSVSCTPPNNNGGRRNFVVNNMVAGCIYRISNCGSGFDTQMTIRNAAGTVVGYNDDNGPACAGAAASIDFTCTASGQYWIQLNRYNCATTNNLNGTITVTLLNCIPPPSNDLCANATNLPCGTTNLAGTTLGSTNIAHATGCGISNFGVWYSFVGDGQTTTVSSTAAGFNHEMVILQGASCGALTTIACVDVTSSTTGVESYPFSTVNGSTYYVYIGHTTSGGSTTGNFTISRTCNTPTIADCSGATQICNDQTFSGNSGGFGTIQELNNLNRGCLNGNEHQSSWYYWVPSANGTISMTTQTSVDYDFAIWQGTNCANLGSPIRCSFAATTGNTGLGNGATDNSEGVFGNGWVAPLNVSAGIFYIMVIDNFDSDNTPFTIDFTFSVPDLLNCTPTPLPVELLDFYGDYNEKTNMNELVWKTASENNASHYIIQRSDDNVIYQTIDKIDATNTSQFAEYKIEDRNFTRNAVNYYRLLQYDFEGGFTEFNTVYIDNFSGKIIYKIYNIMGQEVDLNYVGLKIIQYTDNTIEKTF